MAEVDTINCTHLYRAFGYHRYDAAQRVLARNGWAYDIYTDAWLSPDAATRENGTRDAKRRVTRISPRFYAHG